MESLQEQLQRVETYSHKAQLEAQRLREGVIDELDSLVFNTQAAHDIAVQIKAETLTGEPE